MDKLKCAQDLFDIFENEIGVHPQMEYCKQLVEDCVEAKQGLADMLSKHPQWDEDTWRVYIPDGTLFRGHDSSVASYRLHDILSYIRFAQRYFPVGITAEERARYKMYSDLRHMAKVITISWEFAEETTIPRGETVTQFDGTMRTREPDVVTRVKRYMQYAESAPMIHEGRKTNREVLNLLRQYGLDTLIKGTPELDEIHHKIMSAYAAYADAMNPIKMRQEMFLSLNPLDFITSSWGNSWDSCHDTRYNHWRDASICYCAGCESYACDETSLIFFTVKPDDFEQKYMNEGVPVHRLGKVYREITFWSGEAEHTMAFSRLYPQSNDSNPEGIYEQIRRAVETVVAESLGVANMWAKTEGEVVHHGHEYPDPIHYVGYPTELDKPDHWVSIAAGKEDVICVECGGNIDYYDDSDYKPPVCSDCADVSAGGGSYCECCDSRVPDDELTYVEDYGYVCSHCFEYNDDFFYCDYHGEWEYGRNHYSAEDGCVICESALDNGDYVVCTDCGDIYPASEVSRIDGENVCHDCIKSDPKRYEGYEECALCGDYHLSEEMLDIDGLRVCSDCYRRVATTCDSCGTVHLRKNICYFVGRFMYCQDCVDRMLASGEVIRHNGYYVFAEHMTEYRLPDLSSYYGTDADYWDFGTFYQNRLDNYKACYTDIDNVLFVESLVA